MRNNTLKKRGDKKGTARSVRNGSYEAVSPLLSRRRSIRKTKTGNLRINLAKVQKERALDVKDLLSSFNDTISAEDGALGLKHLAKEEKAFRTLNATSALLSTKGREDTSYRPALFSGFASGPDRGAGNGRNVGSNPLGDGALSSWRIFLKRWAGFSSGRNYPRTKLTS